MKGKPLPWAHLPVVPMGLPPDPDAVAAALEIGSRRLPCVHEGPVIESCSSCGALGEGRHVRDCAVHDRCTRTSLGGPVRGCDSCPDYRRPVAVRVSAGGIGDAVCALYAACGLANSLQEPVAYRCRHVTWLADVSHPWLSIVRELGRPDVATDMGSDYDGELWAANRRTCPSRVQWYCDRLADQLGVPKFSGARPFGVRKPAPVEGDGYVLMAPKSALPQREWPAAGWSELARQVRLVGRRVLAVGAAVHEADLRRLFGGVGVEIHVGRPVGEVLSLVANAGQFYGLDSGLTHIAGLYGTPSLAIMTHMPASFVFGDLAPSVVGVGADTASWPCQGCGWRGDYYQATCRRACRALISISVDRVRASRA